MSPKQPKQKKKVVTVKAWAIYDTKKKKIVSDMSDPLLYCISPSKKDMEDASFFTSEKVVEVSITYIAPIKR